ncbi:MAG: DEAD/DEAH box helicase, partial [Treponema sp.]|nr:DEAD/DEAH box helicase [Treponema sp.]
ENLKKNKPDIIVGNPGRILALAKKGIIKLNINVLILDEADRLVSEELSGELNGLCEMIMKDRRKNDNGLILGACSATMNKKNRKKILDAVFQTESGKINIPFIESDSSEIIRGKIEHWAIFSERRRKDQTLRSLLAAVKTKKKKVKVLVFTGRSDEAGFILTRLQHHHVPSAGLFGKISKKPMSSQERKAALESFRQGGIDVLVSTDLAARGLDIAGINMVVALDVPSDSEVYIHRCGRTARAGKRGIMVTIGDETQMRLLALLEKKLKIKVQPKELHYGEVCAPQP